MYIMALRAEIDLYIMKARCTIKSRYFEAIARAVIVICFDSIITRVPVNLGIERDDSLCLGTRALCVSLTFLQLITDRKIVRSRDRTKATNVPESLRFRLAGERSCKSRHDNSGVSRTAGARVQFKVGRTSSSIVLFAV